MFGRPPSPLVAVNVDRGHQETIARSVWSITTIEFIDCQEVDRFCDDSCAVDAFLIALSPRRGSVVDETIRRLRRARPASTIIAYAGGSTDWPATVRAIHSGANSIALHGFDDLRVIIRRALIDVALAPACTATVDLVLPWVRRPVHQIIEYCTVCAPRDIGVDEVAATLHLSARTVNRQLHAMGLPTIAATISWCRLFVAAYLISRRSERVERVAGILGYGSGSALRNMLRRYTNLATPAMRDPDAVGRLARLYGAIGRSTTDAIELQA